MFYQKTDTEILCETLIKLSDKQERFVEKFGASITSPYHESLHSLIKILETHFELRGQIQKIKDDPIFVQEDADILLNEADKKVKSLRKNKAEPQKRYFKGTKQKLTVELGKSDDVRSIGTSVPRKQVEWTKEEQEEVSEPTEGPRRQVIMETVEEEAEETKNDAVPTSEVTPENIDRLAEGVMGSFEPGNVVLSQRRMVSPTN